MARTAPQLKHKTPLNINFKAFSSFGLICILFFSPLFRGLFFAQEYLPAVMAVAVVFFLAAAHRWNTRQGAAISSYLDIAVIAYLIFYLVSLMNAVSIHDAITTTLKVAAYVLIYWTVSRSIEKEKDALTLLNALFAGGLAVAAVGLAASLGVFDYPGAFNGKYILSTFQYPNTLGAVMGVTSVLGFFLWVQSSNSWLKLYYSIAVVLQGITLVAAYSKGALMLYPLAMVMLLLGTPREYFWQMFANQAAALVTVMLASRFFFPAMVDGWGTYQALILAAAILAIITYNVLADVMAKIIDRFDPTEKTKTIMAWGIMIYLCLVVGGYIIYSSQVLPNVYAQFLPASVVNEMNSIQSTDISQVGRVNMYQDAFAMVKDYPIFGTGGGGWNALYHLYQDELYWTTEVHNHFLQTWVESGSIGFLAYIFIWIFALIYIFRIFRWRWRGLGPDQWLKVWTLTSAITVLGVHSFMDFDLSLPAVSIILWALFGILQGIAALYIAGDSWFSIPEIKLTPPWWLMPVAALIITLALFIPANFMYRAGVTAAQGARAMAAQELYAARDYLEKAHRLNPWQPNYLADLAQVNAAIGLKAKDAEKRVQARKIAGEAALKGKYSVPVQQGLVNAYLLLDDMAEALKHTERIVEINPLDVNSYEILSRSYYTSGVRLLKEGRRDKALLMIEQAVELPRQLEQKIASISPDPAVRWQGRELAPTPLLKLTQAQGYLLLENYWQAHAIFLEIKDDEQFGPRALQMAQEAEAVLYGQKDRKDILQLLGISDS
ncbi:O-antigen ligase family protein [Metallumcola ferriviriculae]|uniref:O-antigen ligase family protein n=1 Tax=Metallumcola ferriviriculae TaxID=3039180 RepID=A0AAU0UQW9_9FIRM|nr:O-antigen ligase family protein [Desulfitibacteraceae bacterium MK1]